MSNVQSKTHSKAIVIFEYLRKFKKEHHDRLPTYREAAEYFSTCVSVLYYWINILEKMGLVGFEITPGTRYYYLIDLEKIDGTNTSTV